MLLVLAIKTLVLGLCMLPISAAALGVGILFAGYNIAVSRNPDEAETIFNGTLMGFALVETFVFMSFFLESSFTLSNHLKKNSELGPGLLV